MKKFMLLVFLLLTFLINLYSQKITLADAEKVARNFFYERINQYQTTKYEDVGIVNSQIVFESERPVYYVFNMSQGGFVLVSASRNTVPVPAYSLETSSTGENQPPQFIAWIEQYKQQIIFAIDNQVNPFPETISEWNRLLTDNPLNLKFLKGRKDVQPMLISNWDQGQFYNQMCPSDPAGPAGHCYTGCVATAMGQICYYFRWPEAGTGSYSYVHPVYGTLSANFADTRYDWNAMTNNVQQQNEPVAELLYHMGVSVDMDYGPNGSGMWNHKAAYSLRTYFRYCPETQYLYRDSTDLDWDSVIVAHLDRGIPMYYAGWSVPNVNGHAFVCDGYQTNDYFHFNWGWSGSYNGYFYLDELIPGGSNFNLAQELIINCCPDSVSYTYPTFCTVPDTSLALNGSLEDGSGPNHDYKDNSDCTWLISPQSFEDSVTSIIISFNKFDTEQDHDFLTVYDGETESSPMLGQFSGSELPEAINSTGNKVLITFKSDGNGSSAGWFLSYNSVVPDWCTGMQLLTGWNDTISDGSGSFYYQSGSICIWNIQPPGATEVTINFLDFDTETDRDLVKIYDAGSNQLLATYSGTYTGGTVPDPVTSPSGKMMITFSTNGTITRQGWSAFYLAYITGIDPSSEFSKLISITPNPFDQKILVGLNNVESQDFNIEISDLQGHRVYSEMLIGYPDGKPYILDLSGLRAGIYLIKITSQDSHFYQKIVKLK